MKRRRCIGKNAKGTGPCQSSASDGFDTCARCGQRRKPRAEKRLTSADIAKRPPTNSLGEPWTEGQTWTCTKCGASGPDRDDVRMPASCECVAPILYGPHSHDVAVRVHLESIRAKRRAEDADEPDDAEAHHEAIESALDSQSEAVLDANADAEWQSAIADEMPTDTDLDRRIAEAEACAAALIEEGLCAPCPGCGRAVADGDGFGVLAHIGPNGCGYCTHPSRTDGVCGICGDVERDESTASAVSPEVNRPVAEGPVEAVDAVPSRRAKKPKPVAESVLPGLEGYAKRDVSLGQWDTHPEVARAFVRWCGDVDGSRVLEPSAGIGNIARALVDARADVTCVEIDSDRACVLRERGLGTVHAADFLAMGDGALVPGEFDSVAMNPPYENDGETRHMLHALAFAPVVRAIVRLVALASASRATSWRSVDVTRIAVLVPRPVFAGSSGMDEIAFVEIMRPEPGAESWCSEPRLEWLDWRLA